MSRKPFEVTPEMRARVKSLAGVGVPQEDIATLIDCSPKTLRKHFREELDVGMAEATAVIARELFRLVQAGNTAAQIFWTKVQGVGGNPELAAEVKRAADEAPRPSVLVILPVNPRDPPVVARAEAIWADAEALKQRDEARRAREAERYRRKKNPNTATAPDHDGRHKPNTE